MNIVKDVSLCAVILSSIVCSSLNYGMEPAMAQTEQVDIFQAIRMGDLSRVYELIATGVDVNQQDGCLGAPLHYASFYEHTAIIEALIKAGADINKRNGANQAPLHIAVLNGNYAIQNGNIDAAETLIRAGADVNLQENSGLTPLHYAVHGNITLIQLLVLAGANIELCDNKGSTPLMEAMMFNKIATVDLLIDYQHRIAVARKERAKEKLLTLAMAIHERLGENSPAAQLDQYVLQLLFPYIVQLTTAAEFQEALQPRAQVIAHTLAMANHERLGAHSPLAMLPQELLRNISQLAVRAEDESRHQPK